MEIMKPIDKNFLPWQLVLMNKVLLLLSIFFTIELLLCMFNLPHINWYIVVVWGATVNSLLFVFNKAENIIRKKTNGN